MKKSKLIWLFVFSLFFALSGYIFIKSYTVGLCFMDPNSNIYDTSCHLLYSKIGNPLFYGMGALAIVFLILLFKQSAVSAWKKFAVWYIPIAALIFIFYPNPGSGDFFSPYPEQVFQWLSAGYVLVSALIILLKRPQTSL